MKVVGQRARDCHETRLLSMAELSMTPFLANQEPTVSLDESHYVEHLHAFLMVVKRSVFQ